ncbi:MAG: His-Xaa-Ser system-associated MauG-like protein [Pseudomonadota bacterium]
MSFGTDYANMLAPRDLSVPALAILACFVCALASGAAAEPMRDLVLRDYAVAFGLTHPEETWVETDPDRVAVGQRLFESVLLSSERDTACASCHLDRFGSADGLPIAVGVEGQGSGPDRVRRGGDPQPRNALPLWGRGGVGFDTLFWDGRVEALPSGTVHSQFGRDAPSDDPLTVAAHLPPLQLGEMVFDRDSTFDAYEREAVDAAKAFGEVIVERLRTESDIVDALGIALDIRPAAVSYTDAMGAVAQFIAHNFRLQETRFHAFVFGNSALTLEELRGGLTFYGKGQCVACHNGAYFSDMDHHVIAFPQLGFGANGFGVDYGRYNVTQDPGDLFAFRTPPLLNVARTAPYGHSGSVPDLKTAIRLHVDPLAVTLPEGLAPEDRQQYARRLGLWAQGYPVVATLTDRDVTDLVAFLNTLNYESASPVAEIDVNER